MFPREVRISAGKQLLQIFPFGETQKNNKNKKAAGTGVMPALPEGSKMGTTPPPPRNGDRSSEPPNHGGGGTQGNVPAVTSPLLDSSRIEPKTSPGRRRIGDKGTQRCRGWVGTVITVDY